MNAGVEADRLAAAAVRRTGDATAVAAALLHDVVETGQIADRDLDAVVSDPRVVELVRCLTRQPGESDRAPSASL